MNFFKRKPKPREYIISYKIVSEGSKSRGNGHTYRYELDGGKFNYDEWHKQTSEYWNESWGVRDVRIIITNIFENK